MHRRPGLHHGWRAWKGFDRDAMDRLHREVFTEQGRREAERLFRRLFARRP